MGLLAPQEGTAFLEPLMLGIGSLPSNYNLHLYTNNHTPANGDNVGSYTEVSDTGYSIATVNPGDWTVTNLGGTTTATASQKVFGPFGSSQTIYGYYVTDATNGTVLWAELALGAPFNLSPGQSLGVTLVIALS